ncbi:hypothetical protein [Microbacterium sp. BK668]|uniref:hypothetical protein n=1 Tax=Microbacterium sp. BK668 TaxID=2512118 RepID=UPI00105E3AC7|nr:hypothetical protein [Microbacterium sp. BK668]TDN92628.1 hypothetical protein EV279_2154 [Microbacterium sp. BK668]
MGEQERNANQAGWIGMLLFAACFVGLGVWGLATGEVAWGVGSVLFGIVWAFAALRARRKTKPEGRTAKRQ